MNKSACTSGKNFGQPDFDLLVAGSKKFEGIAVGNPNDTTLNLLRQGLQGHQEHDQKND